MQGTRSLRFYKVDWEIPITVVVKMQEASSAVFDKMKGFILDYYKESENIKKSKVQS